MGMIRPVHSASRNDKSSARAGPEPPRKGLIKPVFSASKATESNKSGARRWPGPRPPPQRKRKISPETATTHLDATAAYKAIKRPAARASPEPPPPRKRKVLPNAVTAHPDATDTFATEQPIELALPKLDPHRGPDRPGLQTWTYTERSLRTGRVIEHIIYAVIVRFDGPDVIVRKTGGMAREYRIPRRNFSSRSRVRLDRIEPDIPVQSIERDDDVLEVGCGDDVQAGGSDDVRGDGSDMMEVDGGAVATNIEVNSLNRDHPPDSEHGTESTGLMHMARRTLDSMQGSVAVIDS